MKMKLSTVLSIVAASFALISSGTAVAQTQSGGGESMRPKPPSSGNVSADQTRQSQGAGGAIVATAITPQEAAKKYPAAKGKYPMGERDPHKASGIVNSPYPPHTEFDCSNVAHGGLVLDTHTNKVFVRP